MGQRPNRDPAAKTKAAQTNRFAPLSTWHPRGESNPQLALRSLAFLLVRYTHHNFPLFLIRYGIVWLLVNLHKNPSNAASLWAVQNVKLANS